MAKIVNATIIANGEVWAVGLDDSVDPFTKLITELVKHLRQHPTVRVIDYWTVVAILIADSH